MMKLKSIFAGTATVIALMATNLVEVKAATEPAASSSSDTTVTSSESSSQQSQVKLRSSQSTTGSASSSETSVAPNNDADTSSSGNTGNKGTKTTTTNATATSNSNVTKTTPATNTSKLQTDTTAQKQSASTSPAKRTSRQTAAQVRAAVKSALAKSANQQILINMYSAMTTSQKDSDAHSTRMAYGHVNATALRALVKATIPISGLDGTDATVTNADGSAVTVTPTYGSNYAITYNWSVANGVTINDGDTATVTMPDGYQYKDSDLSVIDLNTGATVGNVKANADGKTAVLTFTQDYNLDDRKGQLVFGATGTATGTGAPSAMNKMGWLFNDAKTIIQWQVVFNINAETWQNVVLKDQIGLYQSYDPDTLEVQSGTYTDGKFMPVGDDLVEGTDYTFTQVGNELTFTFLHNVTTPTNILYKTNITDTNQLYTNVATASFGEGTGSVPVTQITTASSQVGGSGTAGGKEYSILTTKTDATTGLPVVGATYSLFASDQTTLLRSGLTTDDNGQFTLPDILSSTYYLRETSAPAGYLLDNTFHAVVVSSDTADADTVTVPIKVTDTKIPVTSLNVVKVWQNVPTDTTTPDVTVTLKDNKGDAVGTLTLTAANGYKGTFSNLPTTESDGTTPITYVIVETVPAGYTTSQSTDTDTNTVTLTNTYETGTVSLTKVSDSGAALLGAEFTLTDKSTQTVVATGTTDTNGKLSFSGLNQGTYTLTETKTPAGYQTVAPQDVTISTSAYLVELTLTDPAIPTTSINVQKTWNMSGATGVTTPAVTISLLANQTATGNTLTLDSTNGYAAAFTGLPTTDANGKAIVYTLQEVAIPGYTTSGGDIVAGVAAFTNTLQVSSLVVTKQDGLTKTDLAGATFELKDAKGNVIATKTTDSNGQLTFDSLVSGTYTLTETVAPAGYALAADQAVTIDAATSSIANVTVDDTALTATLTVTKQDSSTQAKLAGATFTLLDDAGNVVKSGTTDADGQLTWTDLATGTYTLKETAAPAGYELAADQTVTIDVKTSTTVAVNVKDTKIPVVITTPKASLTITKEDHSTQAALAGATFELVNANGQVVRTGTTDVNGQLTWRDLASGTYTLTETVAPSGYELAAEQAVIIDAGTNTVVAVTVNDSRTPTTPTTPTTPNTPKIPDIPGTPGNPTPGEPTPDVLTGGGNSGGSNKTHGKTPVNPKVKVTGHATITKRFTTTGTRNALKTLPQTNEQSAVWVVILGFCLLLASGLGFRRFKQD